MTLELILAFTAIGAAGLAWFLARRASRRVNQLTDSYWQLRYEYGQLRSRVTRLEGGTEGEPPAAGAEPPGGSFIPLSSIKR